MKPMLVGMLLLVSLPQQCTSWLGWETPAEEGRTPSILGAVIHAPNEPATLTRILNQTIISTFQTGQMDWLEFIPDRDARPLAALDIALANPVQLVVVVLPDDPAPLEDYARAYPHLSFVVISHQEAQTPSENVIYIDLNQIQTLETELQRIVSTLTS